MGWMWKINPTAGQSTLVVLASMARNMKASGHKRGSGLQQLGLIPPLMVSELQLVCILYAREQKSIGKARCEQLIH